MWWGWYGHALIPIDNRRTLKHGFRFLRGWPGALSACQTWRPIVFFGGFLLKDFYCSVTMVRELGLSNLSWKTERSLETTVKKILQLQCWVHCLCICLCINMHVCHCRLYISCVQYLRAFHTPFTTPWGNPRG